MASMDLSSQRKAPGVSVFWMIAGVAVAAVVILAASLAFLENDASPTAGTTTTTTEETGPAPEGVADINGTGINPPAGTDDILQNGSGATMGGDVQGSVARTDDTPTGTTPGEAPAGVVTPDQ
ncbi:hypothetical protein [Pseudooctadecabacter sp.]|uniref:hypothetical protein n=1 Tax=Pseudooctadecabacter sp. TaxID=1966338 RepID=UPI0035C7B90A